MGNIRENVSPAHREAQCQSLWLVAFANVQNRWDITGILRVIT